MIIVKLKGGLGNQMFQYAVAKGLKNEKIFFDLTFLSENHIATELFTPRVIEINIFSNIKIELVSNFINSIFNKNTLLFKILRKILSNCIIKATQVENEYFHFPSQKKKIIILDGYFQSEKYFKTIRSEILNDFKFPDLDKNNDFIKKQINECKDSVCIHVRRGDYLKPKVLNYMGLIPLSYYKIAISIVEQRINKPTYFIFSDDPDYCFEKFSFLENKFFINGNKNEESWKDMALMANCKHHIIANSSFSWWGAWLSNKNGFKFAPINWFNSKVADYNIHDFIPSSWEIIQYD